MLILCACVACRSVHKNFGRALLNVGRVPQSSAHRLLGQVLLLKSSGRAPWYQWFNLLKELRTRTSCDSGRPQPSRPLIQCCHLYKVLEKCAWKSELNHDLDLRRQRPQRPRQSVLAQLFGALVREAFGGGPRHGGVVVDVPKFENFPKTSMQIRPKRYRHCR